MGTAGAAYLVHPDGGAGVGPGVLVLSSWWGLTPTCKERCHALADLGYVALAPDLMEGALPNNSTEAESELAATDPNTTAALVLSSLVTLRTQTRHPEGPVAVIGWSMGASWAVWAATRQPLSVSAAVAYYGTQDIDFSDLRAPILGHFGTEDEVVSEDLVTEMHAHLLLLDKSVVIHHYAGAGHFFAEAESPTAHDSAAEALAWDRTVEFLAAHQSSSQ